MKQRNKLLGVWHSMKNRCNNPNQEGYSRYGARGIKVCDEWQSFKTFEKWALKSGYEEGLTIERIDNNGNYEPQNCCFATRSEQSRNRRSNRQVTAWGETKLLVEWVNDPRCTISMKRLWSRLERDKWEPEKAIGTPPNATRTKHLITAWGETKSVPEWFSDPRCCLDSRQTLYTRLFRDGMEPELAMTKN